MAADETIAAQSQPQRDPLLAEFGRPLRDFLKTESGSAGLLLAATVFALLWANSPWSDSYESLWSTVATVSVGSREISMDLAHWVNDGLMVIFFFVIGLEMRHEISVGELRQRRRLVIPALGGIGGLVVPALIYLLINPSGDAARGWGVTIGTDTAFLLGALALVGPKASMRLRIFLLTMTIIDDMLAVAVIGVVYSESISLVAIGIAGVFLLSISFLGRLGAGQTLMYLLAGVGGWLATLESGLHPSIIGMLAGLLVVAHPPRRDALDRAADLFKAFRQSPLPSVAVSASSGLQRAISPNERFQQLLHPWTSYVIVPIFAIANAGVDLRGGVLGDALQSPVTWGVVVGLVVGKMVGIGVATIGGSRLGLGPMPLGVGPGQALGGAALSGLGFSVSLLIVALAFESAELRQQATIGVLMACVLSVVTGWATFRIAGALGEKTFASATALYPPVDPARDHIRGRVDAPTTIVEFADYECAFCSASTHVVDELFEELGDDLRYVFRHLPLVDVHPHAEQAAAAAEAAGTQGRFWEMHELLFQRQDELEIEDLIGYAGALQLDVEEFTRALTEGRHAETVRDDARSAEVSGAAATPTFFIDGERHIGPWDTQSLLRAIEARRREGAPTTERAG